MSAGTVGERFAHALFDCGDELPWHDAADDLVLERDARAALARLETQPHVAELTVAARLMFIARVDLGGTGDRLEIRDGRRGGVDRDLVLARQAFDRDRNVLFATAQ